jgi:hypothetical protein
MDNTQNQKHSQIMCDRDIVRVFNKPGILLKPGLAQNFQTLPRVFRIELPSIEINPCTRMMLIDELGSIAYALLAYNRTDQGNRLFELLESDSTLYKNELAIANCLELPHADVFRYAAIRARRFFDDRYSPRKRGPERKYSDGEIAWELLFSMKISDAAERLGISRQLISLRINEANDESALAFFRGAFPYSGGPKKKSNAEVGAELVIHKGSSPSPHQTDR